MSNDVPVTIDWPVLPKTWLESVAAKIPALARDLVDTITTEIPEYRRDPGGFIAAETRRNVNEALRIFVLRISRGVPLPVGHEEIFRRLGRLEAEAGRSHDTLQVAYRLASRTIMRHLLAWERQFPLSGDTVARLSTAIFTFIDHLAALSAEGFDDGRLGRGEASMRARLLMLLLDRKSPRDQVLGLAGQLHWTMPERASILEVIGFGRCDADSLAALGVEMAGPNGLAAEISGRHLVLAPEPVDDLSLLGALARGSGPLEPAEGRDPWVSVGFWLPVAEVPESYRWAHLAARMRKRGLLGRDPVLRCEDHAVQLLAAAERPMHDQLVARRLQPLAGMSASKRVKYGRLLSAWLELGGLRGTAPGVLDKHRQTLRYQITRLEELFGDALADRDARLEIMLALRAVLPQWEAEAERTARRATPDSYEPDEVGTGEAARHALG